MEAMIWRLEWSRAFGRPRLFRMNVLVPALLVGAMVLGGAPAVHASVAYATLFVFFGTFGSAVPLVRDSESGRVRRLAMTGILPGSIVVQRCLAGAALDTVQLAPALILIGLAGSLSALPAAIAALLLAMVLANVFGAWIAAFARSVAESALFASVASLLLLHASGVFRTPAPDTVAHRVLEASPYAALHVSMLRLTGLETGTTEPRLLLTCAVWGFGATAVSALFGGRILRRLT